MIPLTNFRVGRSSDITPGTLVAWPISKAYCYGLTVSIQRGNSTTQGVISLAPADDMALPRFTHIGMEYCLVFPGKPVVTWNAQLSHLVRPMYETPQTAHIAVCGDLLLLSGHMPGGKPTEPSYWDLASGQHVTVPYDSTIFLTEWDLSIATADGNLQSIIHYRAPSPI